MRRRRRRSRSDTSRRVRTAILAVSSLSPSSAHASARVACRQVVAVQQVGKLPRALPRRATWRFAPPRAASRCVSPRAAMVCCMAARSSTRFGIAVEIAPSALVRQIQIASIGVVPVMTTKMLLTVALLSAGVSAPAQAVNPVVQWHGTLLGIVRTRGAQPPTIHPTRSFAIMHAAIYDAVNAIDKTHTPYLFDLTGVSQSVSQGAAAAAAAHEVLVALRSEERRGGHA